MTRVRSRLFVSSTSDLSSRSATFVMPTGPSFAVPSVPVTRRPPSARLEYAWAMSSAVTPVFRPPSVIAGLRETGVRMPSSLALRATRFRPAFMPTCT